jgi:hypothetical protein
VLEDDGISFRTERRIFEEIVLEHFHVFEVFFVLVVFIVAEFGFDALIFIRDKYSTLSLEKT